MMPGPTLVKECPSCAAPVGQSTLTSGNTLWAVYWTDGKCEAPMLPETPWLVRCPHCEESFWLDLARSIGSCDPMEDEFRGQRILGYQDPGEDDLGRAIAKFGDQGDRGRCLRRMLWWLSNDRVRHPERNAGDPHRALDRRQESPWQDSANMEALAATLDENSPEGLLMKAELMRELGRHAEALELLRRELPSTYEPAVRRISELASAGDCLVAKF